MPRRRLPRISIVGAGAVGSALGRALSEKGYPVVSVISRTGAPAIALARAVGCGRASTNISGLSPATELLLLTVTDESIGEVAAEIAKLRTLDFKKLFAAHCSGVYSAAVLGPLRKRGAMVASLHPVQTFPPVRRAGARRANLRGITYAIDGERDALQQAERLIAELGGKPLIVRAELRPIHHVASVFASNYLMVFLNAVEELTKSLGVGATWQEIYGPLMTTTMEHAVKARPAASLTGPIMRHDFTTIELHLAALARHAPRLLPFYISGGIEVARVGREQERISREEFTRIMTLFRRSLKNHSFSNQGKGKR